MTVNKIKLNTSLSQSLMILIFCYQSPCCRVAAVAAEIRQLLFLL
jgi:hypothetical protein